MKFLRRALGALLLLTLIGAGSLHLRIEHLVNRPVPTAVDPAYVVAADQYYFAYGSNMSTRYLYNVRGILPAQSQPGIIENHEISFLASSVKGLPAFAYLMKAEGKRAYGVLHRVSKQDLDRIKASEGAAYEWATLPVQLGNGQVVSAQTLLRLSPGETGKPSKRYVQLLIEGATEHGLPAAYLANLQGMQSVHIPVVSELMGDILQAAVMKSSGKCASLITC
jgi:hypothetical protein